MKEKVNTHFSFPLRLDMTPYTEDFLMGKGERKEGSYKRHETPRKTESSLKRLCFVLCHEWKSEQYLSCAAGFREEGEAKVTESYEYDLIGVTVHTGTADGGHYYSFIRDIVNPHAYKNNKWWAQKHVGVEITIQIHVPQTGTVVSWI